MSLIQNEFNSASELYDSQRRHLIPCFDEFYRIPLELSRQVSHVRRILDIGAGTGLMSAFFHQQYPHAHITLVDFSEDMLHKARQRFVGKNNFHYLALDFNAADFNENEYDLVISGLAIHHLTHEAKRRLFFKIYNILVPNGWFINADQILGESDFADKLYRDGWRQKIEASPLTEEEKNSAFNRLQFDIFSPLSQQLQWLREAGFNKVHNYYQYYNFVVFAGIK